MAARSYWFVTHSGEQRFAREWPAGRNPQGTIVLIPGLSDHTGRFEHAGSFFSNAGFGVHGFDLPGNGESPGKRGHFESLEEVLEEIGSFIKMVAELQPDLPCFLYGQSMGGTLVLNYSITRKAGLSGIIASSPWLKLANPPGKVREFLARLAGRLKPSVSQPNGINPSDLSHDESVMRSYATDPLVHHRITVGTYNLISRAGQFAISKAREVKLPLLIMHGTADQLTSIDASREFFSRTAGDVTLRIWPGLKHELHNEPSGDEILRYVLHWMESRLTQYPQPVV